MLKNNISKLKTKRTIHPLDSDELIDFNRDKIM